MPSALGWSNDMVSPSPYFVRERKNWRGYGSAVCFHCRLHANTDAEGVFQEHHDVVRTGDDPRERHRYGHQDGWARAHRYRYIPDENQPEICPGSGTAPIPLAYRFPDGTKVPRWYY